jgi:hypothetical protein
MSLQLLFFAANQLLSSFAGVQAHEKTIKMLRQTITFDLAACFTTKPVLLKPFSGGPSAGLRRPPSPF